MRPDTILSSYLALFAFQTIWQIFLEVLNLRHARKLSMPQFLSRHIDEETFKRSVSYTAAKGRFAIAAVLYSAALLLVFVLGGLFGSVEAQLKLWGLSGTWGGILYVLAVALVFSAWNLPLDLYATFVIEERFGFNKTTFWLWVGDLFKGLCISLVISVPLLYALFWFMDLTGRYWWLYGFVLMAGVQLVLIYIYPVVLAPLFNKFTPLADGELKESISALAAQLGFGIKGIFVMDSSRRSTHGNAYFTGFGALKRVVLFDTLLSSLNHQQTTAVLAHEIGHQKMQHIKKYLALSLAGSFLGFWLLSLAINYAPLFEAFGFEAPSLGGAIVLMGFVCGPLLFLLSPIFSAISRHFEYQADRFAVRACNGAEQLAEALTELSKKSLSNLAPHPWYSFFHYSHPALLERIVAMHAYAAGLESKDTSAAPDNT